MNTNTQTTVDTNNAQAAEDLAQEVATVGLELLSDKAKVPEIITKLNEIITKLNELNAAPKVKARDRGPDSQREMTEDDARKVLIGELKDLGHKEAALKLGLSYGQIYSARKGFTFKGVYKEMRDAAQK